METTNSVICDFYAKHPSVNFETVNLMFIKLFETVLIDSVHATNGEHVTNNHGLGTSAAVDADRGLTLGADGAVHQDGVGGQT